MKQKKNDQKMADSVEFFICRIFTYCLNPEQIPNHLLTKVRLKKKGKKFFCSTFNIYTIMCTNVVRLFVDFLHFTYCSNPDQIPKHLLTEDKTYQKKG